MQANVGVSPDRLLRDCCKAVARGVAFYAVNRSSDSFRLKSFAAAIWDFDALAIMGTPVRSRFLFAGYARAVLDDVRR